MHPRSKNGSLTKENLKFVFEVFRERRKRLTKKNPKRNEETTSSLKRLITVQEASTEKNTIYREALISLWNYKCQRQAWKFINYYTMKSLILAQDER